MKQEKIYLKDYQRPAYAVESLNLDFVLNEDACQVTATSKIRRLRQEPMVLNGLDFRLVSLKVNNNLLSSSDYSVADEELTIANPPETFTLEVVTELKPHENTSLEGLYKSNGIFCTQCEAEGFRKITYFFDRPDVMTSYEVTLEADKKKYPVLLSNGDRVKVVDLENGRHKAYWRDPHKKPCYLFALVAGDLGVIRDEFITMSGRKVNLEVYAPHGKQDRCHHAMASLKKSMKWDETAFGCEYDLNDYMIVSIDDFNAGAMENKGLNIFNSRLVLADMESATDTDFFNIESVVAHEYFHNWTGNRVTLANWFNLSLKEGLTVFRDQEFSADMTDRGVERIDSVAGLKAAQFAEDAGPNAHPVRPESCMAVDNFFTSTIYEKGSELIRMMQTIVGRKGFRKGMDEYFKRHDGQAVTTDDFAAAISEPNGKDFTQFKRWYTQAGTPEVTVGEHYDAQNKTYTLTLEQSCRPTKESTHKEPFHIPLMMGLLDSQGREMKLESDKISVNTDGKTLVELKERKEEFVFNNVSERPVLSILREFSAPINLKWNAREEDLYLLMQKDSDSFNRYQVTQTLATQVLNSMITLAKSSQPLTVSSKYLMAIGHILADQNMDPAFKARMISLPSSSILAQSQEVFDPAATLQAIETLRFEMARHHRQALLDIYNKYQGVEAKSADAKVHGHRLLKNMALGYLSDLNDPEINSVIEKQYWNAENMTDKLAALNMISNSSLASREKVLHDFYNVWQKDGLVINKWFAVQASTKRADVLKDIQSLVKHPAFNITNPNNVYSLLRAFGANILMFHQGEAYKFYADMLLEIDGKNPQVAARLASAFDLVGKLPPATKEKALTEIRRLLAAPNLSKNARELLQSSLQ